MAITMTIFEDSGPLLAGKGTNRTAVNNIGWKSDGTDENGNHYAFSPIRRPYQIGEDLFALSYKKYHHASIVGPYPKASRVRIKLINEVTGLPFEGYDTESTLAEDVDPNSQVRLFYKLTNIYEQPNNVWDGGMHYLENGTTILYPSLSLTGPEGVQSYPQYLETNTTYYTQYLVTQLAVPVGLGVGNIGKVNIEWYVDEYEDNDI